MVAKSMDIKGFYLVNHSPGCYSYRRSKKGRTYSIFTVNGGKTFLASIEERKRDGSTNCVFSKKYDSIDKCLNIFGM